MKTSGVRSRVVDRQLRGRGVRPVLEGLEERILLYSTTGDRFTYGSRITWSIVPDGTNLGGMTSNLQSVLNSRFGANNWQSAFSAAFATWEYVANVNLVQVSDDGESTGSGNYQQGNPNFGDIRIAGYTQAANILAYTLLPPPSNGGSDAGDIFLNSNQQWNLNSDYDLESVAMHEVGLALGMGENSLNSQVVMYPYYEGVKQQLTSDDIAGIDSVWSARQEDGIAVGNSNFTAAKAANITPYMNVSNNQIVLPQQDVVSINEGYWFSVTTPSNASNNLTVVIQSANLSELSPRVQLYNSSLQGLVQVSAPSNSYGSFTGLSISNATPNTTYYIHVLSSNSGPTGAGAYAMFVNMGTGNLSPVPPPNTQVAAQPDQGSGGAYQQTVPRILSPGQPLVDLPDSFQLANPSNVATTAKISVDTLVAVAAPVIAPTTPAIVTDSARPASSSFDFQKPTKSVSVAVAHPTASALSIYSTQSPKLKRVASKIEKVMNRSKARGT